MMTLKDGPAKGTYMLARREDLRNCRVCALMAQMQMAMPRG